MGQRSQIFINVKKEWFDRENKKHIDKHLVARYYQWNFGERMISRARGIIEYLKEHGTYVPYQIRELTRVCDINWDYHDVVISVDCLKEFTEGRYWNTTKEMFLQQDNNDGVLFIDMLIKEKKLNDDKPDITIKYCFMSCENNYLGDAKAYIDWDLSDWATSLDNEAVTFTKDNIKYLKKNAELMTENEMNKFINRDYAGYKF